MVENGFHNRCDVTACLARLPIFSRGGAVTLRLIEYDDVDHERPRFRRR